MRDPQTSLFTVFFTTGFRGVFFESCHPDDHCDPGKFTDYLDVKYGGRIRCMIPTVSESIQVCTLPLNC